MSRILWILTFVFLAWGVSGLVQSGLPRFFEKSEIEKLVRVRRRIQDFHEKILCGIFPEDEDWREIQGLPAPWGATLSGILVSLREKGASLAPSLNRLKDLCMRQEEAIREGKAKAAAATGQALLVLMILPIFSALLYLLVPGLENRSLLWLTVSGFSIGLAMVGLVWVSRFAEKARYGGLKPEERVWILDASLFLEKLTGFIQAGNSPDCVWADAHQSLPPELASRWGAVLWKVSEEDVEQTLESKTLRQSILSLGDQARRTLQMSLYEGRPAIEALETLSRAFQHEVAAFQERELQKLPIQTLKPLFLTVAPGAFLLLGVSISILVGDAFDSGSGF